MVLILNDLSFWVFGCLISGEEEGFGWNEGSDSSLAGWRMGRRQSLDIEANGSPYFMEAIASWFSTVLRRY